MSWNPSLPAYFGRHNEDQATHDIFLFSGIASHQKRVNRDYICLQRDTGILKQDIVQHGIANRTALRRTCFPVPDKNLVVQRCDFCLIRSTIVAKISFFLRPKFSGRPRYLPMPPSASISSTDLTRGFTS